MTKEEFATILENFVKGYIANSSYFDSDPQLSINPRSLGVELINGRDLSAEIADSDEAVEEAAGVEGDMSEDAADYQAKQNPDFYPVRKLIIRNCDGSLSHDKHALDNIIKKYF